LATDGKMRRKLTDFYILRSCASASLVFDEAHPAVPLATHLRIELLKRLNFHLVINSDMIQSEEFRGEDIVRTVFDGLYLPCDEFKIRSDQMTGYRLLPRDVRKILDQIYKDTEDGILEIRGELGEDNSLLDDIVRLHPAAAVFSLKQIVNVRDYDFRYSIAVSVYKHFVNRGDLYSRLHAVMRARRTAIKRLVCDFIAGMTDRGIVEFYNRIRHEDKRNVLDEFGVYMALNLGNRSVLRSRNLGRGDEPVR